MKLIKTVAKALGPYSLFVRPPPNTKPVHFAGMIGNSPETNELVPGGFEAQIKQVFSNIDHTLDEAGVKKQQIVKANVFLTDMANFQTMNKHYTEYFGNHKPARTAIAVKELPFKALIEIEVLAYE